MNTEFRPLRHRWVNVQLCGVSSKYVDTIALNSRNTTRQRTPYLRPFKAQFVQECLGPDVSIASVALRHGINSNLVRKWIPIYRDQQACALPAFVSLKLETAAATPARQDVARIDISSGQRTFTVNWPTSDPDGCARFISSLSR